MLNSVKDFLCDDNRYVEDARSGIDNNWAERADKPFVMGRKAGLFSTSHQRAEVSAMVV